jgi:ABC-2 type transport system permease protein/lipopolysaccharide transport system permease protein
MSTRTSPSPPHAEFFPPPSVPRERADWWAIVRNDFRELKRFWPVVHNMVSQELRVRYQRSVLGFFWTLLHPILMMATLTVVFSQLLHRGAGDYAVYLFAGMVPWGFLNGSLNECAFCIINAESLIKKIYLPKLVFPLVRALINLTTFGLSMVALFALLVPLGARFSPPMVLLPLIVAVFGAFVLGLSLLVATLNTFYRDTGHLVGVFLQAWYFATPILYPADQFAKVPWLLWLNPAYPFVLLFQKVISEAMWPSPLLFASAAGIAAVCLGVGYAAFKSHEDKLVFRL